MTPGAPRLLPLGEGAWTLALGERHDPALHPRVVALADRVVAAALPGVSDVVPAYTAITVYFDPLATDRDELGRRLLALAEDPAAPATPPPESARRTHQIPVRYDGPDLAEVAARTGLTAAEVVRRHAAVSYRVYLLGFAPGFAYLGDLDPALVLPRRASPRPRVPAGSVAIAGAQTAIYPWPTPGGWHLIGWTGVTCFDPARGVPALFSPGDEVRFSPEAEG